MVQNNDQQMGAAQAEAPVPPAPPQPGPQPRRRAGLWTGVALVGLGILLLVGQLVPGMQLWRWWPLIPVGLGVVQMFGPRRGRWSIRHLGEGLTTVTVGLVLLGQMLGLLRWDVWLNILRLWPVLFISLGLEIIGKATRAEWLRFVGSLVIIAALAYGSLVLTPGFGWPPAHVAGGETFQYVEPRRGSVTAGEARIMGAVGELAVAAGDDLVRAEGSSPYEPVFEVETRGDQVTAEVAAGEGSWRPMTPGSDLEVALDRNVVWDLTVKAGVSDYELDLADIAMSSLTLESGVSDGVLTLGEAGAARVRGAVPVDIDAGVSGLVVRVPRGESVRVTISEGLTGVDAEGGWTQGRDGDSRTYESDGFSDAGAYWDVHIDSGIGSITLRYL